MRRLEALRRAGIVEREAEGVWRIPADLVARGHAYDRRHTGGVDVQLHSHLPIDRQVTTLGATWLDRTLLDAGRPIANVGFGAAVKEALRKRVDFLIERGFAQRDGDRVKFPANLITALRQRDVDSVAKSLAAETGLLHRPLVEGARAAGVYRRMVVTTSGRFAMLDDGLGFSLVPWRRVLEQRIGQQLSATYAVSTSLGALAVNEAFRDSVQVDRPCGESTVDHSNVRLGRKQSEASGGYRPEAAGRIRLSRT